MALTLLYGTLWGKVLNKPAWRLRGGSLEKSIRVYASTLFPESIKEGVERAVHFAEGGTIVFTPQWNNQIIEPTLSLQTLAKA